VLTKHYDARSPTGGRPGENHIEVRQNDGQRTLSNIATLRFSTTNTTENNSDGRRAAAQHTPGSGVDRWPIPQKIKISSRQLRGLREVEAYPIVSVRRRWIFVRAAVSAKYGIKISDPATRTWQARRRHAAGAACAGLSYAARFQIT